MPLAVTIVICTYNGAKRLPLVLEVLKHQNCPAGRWDLLVVDNASIDQSGEIAERFIREKLGGHGRVVREPQPGLSFARARAAREAQGEIICFLDDDNFPASNFVEAVIQAFNEFPKAGVIGGRVLPRWETRPTPLAEAVAAFALAICNEGDTPKQNSGRGVGLIGAGLCVRRDLLCEIFSSSALASTVTDRKKLSLISGGDLAISIMAREMGWECWYVPTLQIEHVLPVERMEKNYLLRLHEGIGRGQSAVRKLYDWKARTPLAWLIGFKDYCRWLLGQWRGPSPELRRQHPEIAGDLHELSQSLTLGRASQALSWPR